MTSNHSTSTFQDVSSWNQPLERTYARISIDARASAYDLDHERWRDLPQALEVVAWHQSHDPSRWYFFSQQRLHRTQAIYVQVQEVLCTVTGSFNPGQHLAPLPRELWEHLRHR